MPLKLIFDQIFFNAFWTRVVDEINVWTVLRHLLLWTRWIYVFIKHKLMFDHYYYFFLYLLFFFFYLLIYIYKCCVGVGVWVVLAVVGCCFILPFYLFLFSWWCGVVCFFCFCFFNQCACIYLCVCLCVCVCVWGGSTSVRVRLFYLFIYLFTYLFIHLFTYLFIYLNMCIYAWMCPVSVVNC